MVVPTCQRGGEERKGEERRERRGEERSISVIPCDLAISWSFPPWGWLPVSLTGTGFGTSVAAQPVPALWSLPASLNLPPAGSSLAQHWYFKQLYLRG